MVSRNFEIKTYSENDIIYKELKFRFFRKFKSKTSPANQYGFLDKQTTEISFSSFIADNWQLNDMVFIYLFYENKIFETDNLECKEIIKLKYEENVKKNNNNVVFVFDIFFKKMIALVDEEIENKLFLKVL
jgi:hypothetical protein